MKIESEPWAYKLMARAVRGMTSSKLVRRGCEKIFFKVMGRKRSEMLLSGQKDCR